MNFCDISTETLLVKGPGQSLVAIDLLICSSNQCASRTDGWGIRYRNVSILSEAILQIIEDIGKSNFSFLVQKYPENGCFCTLTNQATDRDTV